MVALLGKRRAELGAIAAASPTLEKAERALEAARRAMENIELEGKAGSETLAKMERQIELETAALAKAVPKTVIPFLASVLCTVAMALPA